MNFLGISARWKYHFFLNLSQRSTAPVLRGFFMRKKTPRKGGFECFPARPGCNSTWSCPAFPRDCWVSAAASSDAELPEEPSQDYPGWKKSRS